MNSKTLSRRSLLVLAGSAPLLQACYDSGIREWSEDVRLPSGEQFVVKRKIIGNANYAGIGDAGAWIYKSTEIHFPSEIPKAPQMWSGKYKPMVLGRYPDGAFYLVAIFQDSEDYFELYWDVDPLPLFYVQFNWTGDQWQMQKALDPKLLSAKANLLVGSPGKEGQRHWTLADKEKRERKVTPPWYDQVIGGRDPNPPQQSSNGRRNLMEHQQRQKMNGREMMNIEVSEYVRQFHQTDDIKRADWDLPAES